MFLNACCAALLSLTLLKASCHTPQPAANGKEMEFFILHYKVPCVGESVQLCLQVKKAGGAVEYFYDSIEGFTYEWGYNYTLLVEETSVANPRAGGSAIRYKLKKTVRKEKVGPDVTFTLPLQLDGEPLTETKNGRCYYKEGVAIETGSRSCADLQQAQTAVFRHSRNGAGLVLVTLK